MEIITVVESYIRNYLQEVGKRKIKMINFLRKRIRVRILLGLKGPYLAAVNFSVD